MQFLHHIDITVSDIGRARSLYSAFFEHAGLTLKNEGREWAGWGVPGKRYPCITLLGASEPKASKPHDRYSPGLHHLALRAGSRTAVDDLYVRLLALDATILDPPAEYPEYGKGYYALFFADPDGIKLEYAYTPPSAEVRV